MEAIFTLMDSEFTRSMWNCSFRVSYRLILREKELHMNIGVYNPSKDIPFNFNLLLHTYFKCPDVRRCQVTGLHGCTFIDKTREPPNSYQVGGIFSFPIDRKNPENLQHPENPKKTRYFMAWKIRIRKPEIWYLNAPDVRKCQVIGLYGCTAQSHCLTKLENRLTKYADHLKLDRF